MSKPHFLDADESVINGVTGMKPEKEKHDTFLDIEPVSDTNYMKLRNHW